MKTFSPPLLCLCAVLMAPPAIALADDATSSGQTSDGTNTSTNTGQKRELMREAFAQLDLTTDQRLEIRHIRQTVTDPTERHKEIVAVLTPEQKEKLKAFFQQHRNSAGTGGTETNGGPNDAGDGSDLAPGAN
jgi:Spy/CpxP family protein refolding chaperone